MLALIVVANPSPQSLSHAMASAAERVLVARGYEIAYHDLYAEHFDPVQPTGEGGNVGSSNVLVEQHCSELARADLILVFHPNWWGQPPAILKGWIDRVFRLNTAYAYPPWSRVRRGSCWSSASSACDSRQHVQYVSRARGRCVRRST